jgi:thioredoxin-related protein
MRLIWTSVMLAAVMLYAAPLRAAELLMLEQPGCVWCAQFNAEIGKRAPLRRVDITEPWPEDLAGVQKERFTPTFILMENGQEIARLRGYVGDEFFWYRIGEMIALLPDGD